MSETNKRSTSLDETALTLLKAIRDHWEANGWFPSIRELRDRVGGISSPSTVHRHLGTLEQQGYLERYGPQHRYRLTDKELEHVE